MVAILAISKTFKISQAKVLESLYEAGLSLAITQVKTVLGKKVGAALSGISQPLSEITNVHHGKKGRQSNKECPNLKNVNLNR